MLRSTVRAFRSPSVVRATKLTKTLTLGDKEGSPLQDQPKLGGQTPHHDTAGDYAKVKHEGRLNSADPEWGVTPSATQRKLLVWTRLFKDDKQIPTFVHPSTLNRMRDRFRAFMVVVATLGFTTAFMYNRRLRQRIYVENIPAKVEASRRM